MPNPDGSMTEDEIKQMFGNLAGAAQTNQRSAGNPGVVPGSMSSAAPMTQAQRTALISAPGSAPSTRGQVYGTDDYAKGINDRIASGDYLTGQYQSDPHLLAQDSIHGNLDKGQAIAQRQRDFGLGAANNAQTAAMLGQAYATGDKYSSAFGGLAEQTAARSALANSRGLDPYRGDLSGFQQGLANAQQSRGLQTGAYNALMNFAQGPQGPSAAEMQLRQATDANTANALALARSGRGMGGSAAGMRQAIAQNATTQQQAVSQAAELRANEYTAFQNQRLNALNAAGALGGQVVQGDQNLGQLGLAGAQYQSDTALKGTQLNDASAQAWAAQQQAAMQQGLGAEVGAQTQGLNINATALAGRENEYSSANQTYAAEKGFAQAAAIADANRQQAYTAAGLSAAGTVIGALSDEREKMNIQPLSVVQPLNSGSDGNAGKTYMGGPAVKMGPTEAEASDARAQSVGKTAGNVAGGVAGSAVAGPIGGVVGSALGGVIGKGIGKIFSDVRSKTNVRPLSYEGPRYFPGDDLNAPAPVRPQLDPSPFGQLQAIAAQYGAAGVAQSPKAVAQYSSDKPASAERVERRFAKADHPILSEGDSLLADSARNAPGSTYEYKDPQSPGAGPGTYTGPMAQDLASHPLTAGMVGQAPDGKLFVDGSRAAMTGLAQNHSQQKQLDVLDQKIGQLASMLKRKKGDSKATDLGTFNRSTGGL